jgi:hypothetical protein
MVRTKDLLLIVCFFCKFLLHKPLFFKFFVWFLIYISFRRVGVGVSIASQLLRS